MRLAPRAAWYAKKSALWIAKDNLWLSAWKYLPSSTPRFSLASCAMVLVMLMNCLPTLAATRQRDAPDLHVGLVRLRRVFLLLFGPLLHRELRVDSPSPGVLVATRVPLARVLGQLVLGGHRVGAQDSHVEVHLLLWFSIEAVRDEPIWHLVLAREFPGVALTSDRCTGLLELTDHFSQDDVVRVRRGMALSAGADVPGERSGADVPVARLLENVSVVERGWDEEASANHVLHALLRDVVLVPRRERRREEKARKLGPRLLDGCEVGCRCRLLLLRRVL